MKKVREKMDPKNNIEKLISEKECQFRDFRFIKLEQRKADDGSDELVVEGKACSFNDETVLYSYGNYEAREIVDANAFENCDMTDVIFNYNHSGRVYARTRNNTLSLEVKEDGLYMKAVLRSNDQGHKELFDDISTGTIDKMSFAFHVNDSKWEYEEKDGNKIDRRTILAIDKLYDVSAVDIPAYDTTSISARSQFSAVSEKRAAESRETERMLELKKQKLFLLSKME